LSCNSASQLRTSPTSSFIITSHADAIRLVPAINFHPTMSRHRNDNPSNDFTKQKAAIAEMERNVAAARKRLEAQEREHLEEAERAREAAEERQRAEEEQRRAAVARQQQVRTHRARVEVLRRSASPVASRSGVPGLSTRYVGLHYCSADHGTRRTNVLL